MKKKVWLVVCGAAVACTALLGGKAMDIELAPPEVFKTHGAIAVVNSLNSRCYGGVVSNMTDRVQYWMFVHIDGTRDVNPTNVVISSSQKPIVTWTNGLWRVTFQQ